MPSLTWKLIALLTLIFAVAVFLWFIFLWFIFLGPLSRCDRLARDFASSRMDGTYEVLGLLMKRDGCLEGTKFDKDD